MTDLQSTITQYQNSCDALRKRIAEQSARIAGNEPLLPGESIPLLQRRRYLLYTELFEMEGAVRQMEEYLALSQQPGNALLSAAKFA